jgi:hypothetical protein
MVLCVQGFLQAWRTWCSTCVHLGVMDVGVGSVQSFGWVFSGKGTWAAEMGCQGGDSRLTVAPTRLPPSVLYLQLQLLQAGGAAQLIPHPLISLSALRASRSPPVAEFGDVPSHLAPLTLGVLLLGCVLVSQIPV